jgi:hypothetical protein
MPISPDHRAGTLATGAIPTPTNDTSFAIRKEKQQVWVPVVFAMNDLKVGEEIVLAWEWDDNHAVHQRRAVI